jgi:hypothetical protein
MNFGRKLMKLLKSAPKCGRTLTETMNSSRADGDVRWQMYRNETRTATEAFVVIGSSEATKDLRMIVGMNGASVRRRPPIAE